MAILFLVYLLYSLVSVTYLAPIDSEEGWFGDVSVSRRVKRAKVDFPLSRFSVVTWHNYFRRKPAASNMEYLHHSDVLADRALWWARKCRFDYAPQDGPSVSGDILRTTSSPQITNYGQNIYYSSTILDESDLLQMALGAWYDESRVYLSQNDTCLISSCRHYKQLMWAKVQAVGCAAVRCDRLRGPNLANALFLVCNYDIKQTDGQVYQAGYACSNCSKQEPAAKCDEGLCRRDGKGEVISPSENLVLDPVGRATTQKSRQPTVPPGVKEGEESIIQDNIKESNADVILRSPSLSRSTASTPVTRSTSDRSTARSTQPPSTLSSSLFIPGRSSPIYNRPNSRITSPTAASVSRSTTGTVLGRISTAAESSPTGAASGQRTEAIAESSRPAAASGQRTEAIAEYSRTGAASGQRTEAIVRSTPGISTAGRSTVGLFLSDVGDRMSNELRDRRFADFTDWKNVDDLPASGR